SVAHFEPKWVAHNGAIYPEPSDSLFLSFDAQNITDGHYKIKVVGDNEKINEEIQKFKTYKKTLAFNPKCEGKSIKLYHVELSKQIESELNELNLFVRQFNPSSKFIQWAKNDIIYNNANYLINYKAYLFYNNLPKTDSIFKTKMFPIDNPQFLNSSMFSLHVWHYTMDKYIQNNADVINYLNNNNYYEAYKTAIDNIMLNENEGIIRDIMVFKLMNSFFEDSFSDFDRYYKSENYKISNPLLVSELTIRVQQAKKSLKNNIISIDEITKEEHRIVGDLFETIIKDSKGKTLYIDFWATWRGPCRAEIPKLIELHNRIEGKNINIISICCDSDHDTWSVFIKKNNIPGKNYHLDKGQTDLIKSKFKFQGYPTYMIVKDGIIINKNADRPSSGEKIFNELIRVNAL
ncbi:TlpA disulfide reductase family protein, partial [Labilibaculum sp. K2S]|uniref:TlpA family protein disulfide reductase n=1 Tax=Labilibaculum sp. K2S TaxID=3056386 RepID=UPI0025A4365F